ncbi:MAG: hypothetical protein PHQ95_04860 [Candidatus Gracilibacteria bacterium]|nr:hypothetical protein [Candidatus Gracilibacteria bacterium]
MRKLILFITWILSTSVFIQGANGAWYGNTAVSWNTTSNTSCSADGDTIGGTPTGYDGDVAVTQSSTSLTPSPVYNTYALNSNSTNATAVATTGTMYCLKWDGAAPTNPTSLTLTNVKNSNATACNLVGGVYYCKTSSISLTYNWNAGTDTGGSGLKSYQTVFQRASDSVWIMHPFFTTTSGALSPTSLVDGTYYTWVQSVDNAGNAPTTFKQGPSVVIDTTVPTLSDVTNTNASNLLANNAYNYSISITGSGGAPITSITATSENSNNPATTTNRTSANDTLAFNWNISNVDSARQTNGGRQYTFTLTKFCDAAGNCWNGTQAYNYDVYADTLNITTKTTTSSDVTSLTGGSLVADGQAQPLTITLKDTYGNQIVPATGISRTIDFNFNTDNGLYLNQYSRTGVRSVFASIPSASATYANRFAIGTNKTTSFTSQSSSNGIYPFSFKLYTPTYQTYKADPNGKFKINNITFDINGSPGAITAQSILNSTMDFKFQPLYQTTISGDITNGFIEGAQQSSSLSVTKNTTSINGTNPVVQLEFSGADSGKFKLYGGTTMSLALDTGNQIATHADIQSAMTFPSSTTNLYTLLRQNPGTTVGNPVKTSLSTHISYTLDGYPIFYNSDIIGKDNYFSVDTGTTQQTGLKITGLVSTKKSQELVTNQFAYDINILGNSDKFNNKTAIIKSAFEFLNNTSISDQSIKNITNLNGNNVYGKNFPTGVDSSVLYFGELDGANVQLGNGSDVSVSGKRTILIVGGNLYIKNNIYYNSLSSDMLGIVVVKDAQGNGGNIYIDPSVTNITGTLFAEKSIISYDGTKELDGNTPVSALKNQLLIYGNVFSENTIGGSRKSTPECPFYITSGCTVSEAQKYDLNYLRRYYLINNQYPYGNGKVVGGGTCSNTTPFTCGGYNSNLIQTRTFTSTADPYAAYPVIVEYNPNIQKNPPPLFNLTNQN